MSNWYPQSSDLSTPNNLERTFKTLLGKFYTLFDKVNTFEANISKQVPNIVKQSITVIQQELQVGGTAPLNIQGLLGVPTGVASTTTPGTSGTDINWLNGVLEVPSASASARGVVTTGSQTLAGAKNFSTSVAIGGGIPILLFYVYSQSLTPSSVAANITAEQDFTISGLNTADKVFINGPAPTAGTGIVNVRVKTTDTLSITFSNNTAGALTPTSGTYLIVAIRS